MMRKKVESGEENVILVKVLPMGSSPVEVTLPEGATVQDALDATGYNGATARVDGEVADSEDTLDDGDRLVVTNTSSDKIEGGC